jgi:two-component system LytT family sensor kinase
MKIFWKYLFPVLFGLLIYTCIRLVTDTSTGYKFWERSWKINVIEISIVILVTFVSDRLLKYAIRNFQKQESKFSVRNVTIEFSKILLIGLVILNPVVLLIHYLTNDPAGWDDIAIANVIIVLFLLLHYAVIRGNTFIKAYVDQKLQLEKIKTDNLETELKFLKAQYHPHFLFNALNTIYFQMDEDVSGAKKSVEKFSELLRYQLYDQQQTVPVSQEIEYLKNFIELQKIRSTEKLKLEVQFDHNLKNQQVYPLLFLPLVENAFKYTGGDYFLKITAANGNNKIRFSVENSVPVDVPTPDKKGIGLDHLKRRLELLYPGRHELTIEKEAATFKVLLTLDMKNGSLTDE